VSKPVLGLTAGYSDGRRGLFVLREEYFRSVERSGGVPVVLAPCSPAEARTAMRRLDGLILTGGGDVDPALYGQVPHPRLGKVDRARDLFEVALVHEALADDVPVLGVCRGLQLLNVATGGTLHQDIPAELGTSLDHRPKVARFEVAHTVEIVAGSLLHRIVKRESMDVNSLHHQAVDRAGDGLVVTARAGDGVVEALEMPSRTFVLGVQWHPESALDRDLSFGDPFLPLVEAAIRRQRR
jgi:putative glutamine amidotransferase